MVLLDLVDIVSTRQRIRELIRIKAARIRTSRRAPRTAGGVQGLQEGGGMSGPLRDEVG
jgi:hypothetical protein